MASGAREPDFPFDAVLFDLDGTLVATDRFWVGAAGRGCRRAFEELGLERRPPDEAGWMSLVGLPLREGFRALFPDLAPAQLAVVMEHCVAEERAALADGGAELLPGAREALRELRRLGVRTAIASNCEAPYLDAMVAGLALDELVDEAYCLDTPGIASKAEMLARLLEVFGTRSAVMVGDRYTDAEAARKSGLPHVHLARGFAQAGEHIEADAVLGGLGGLLERLRGRERWIEAALGAARVFDRDAPTLLGVTGGPLSGKTLFARDTARLLRRRGRDARMVDERLLRDPGGEGPGEGSVRIVEGHDLRGLPLDFLIRLHVSPATRDLRLAATGPVERPARPGPREPHRPTWDDPDEGASEHADLHLQADNPLGPD
jgi:phosphoglycolate phosphatase